MSIYEDEDDGYNIEEPDNGDEGDSDTHRIYPSSQELTERGYEDLRRCNNPSNEPIGHFTGRCNRCGSKDLWDDNLHYGCNSCGAFLA